MKKLLAKIKNWFSKKKKVEISEQPKVKAEVDRYYRRKRLMNDASFTKL
jgi:hypothetical protein